MTLRKLVLLTVLLGIGAILQQLYLFSSQWDALQTQLTQMEKLSMEVRSALPQKESIRQQIEKAERRHARLRVLLPTKLQHEALETQVAALARKQRIKILATRTAISSRPGYSEATINITLEAGVTAANRFMRELKSIPRRIHIIPPNKRGKKSIHLSISVFAVDGDETETFTPPRCHDMPGGIWLALLREQLAPLYAQYLNQCRFTNHYADHYLRHQRLLALQKKIVRLEVLEQKLRRSH